MTNILPQANGKKIKANLAMQLIASKTTAAAIYYYVEKGKLPLEPSQLLGFLTILITGVF